MSPMSVLQDAGLQEQDLARSKLGSLMVDDAIFHVLHGRFARLSQKFKGLLLFDGEAAGFAQTWGMVSTCKHYIARS